MYEVATEDEQALRTQLGRAREKLDPDGVDSDALVARAEAFAAEAKKGLDDQ